MTSFSPSFPAGRVLSSPPSSPARAGEVQMTDKVVLEGQTEEPQWFVRYCVICGRKFPTLRPDAILCRVWGNSPCATRWYNETHDQDGELLYDDE